MSQKQITVAFYRCRAVEGKKNYGIDRESMDAMLDDLARELSGYDIQLNYCDDDAVTLDINGYGDLLNAVRLRSPLDNIFNLCLGHVIGKSAHLDIIEDVQRGVNRVAFAPETVEPEGSAKIVCHNCGCGC